MKAVLMILVAAIYTSVIFGQSEVDMFLTEAETNIRNNRYDIALNKVQEALNIEPDNERALLLETNIYYLENEYKKAYEALEKAIKRFPEKDEFYYQRGLINIGRQKYQKAIDDFSDLIEGNSKIGLFKVYLNRGVAYMNIQEYEKALYDLTRSIELNSNNASAYHSRGMLNYQLKDYSAAVEDFKQALEYNDNNPETNFNLGMSFFRLEEKDNACPYFHKACKEGNLNACKMVLMECAKEIPE
ncbi:MAG: tetratricopeptide repeat protein [Bacteroidales bacterium]|nr:tetratricopeptide repeat protein [Bacteroidales bacterium]